MNIEPSAKAVVISEGRILLVRYKDTSYDLGTWYSLPGGRQRFGQDLAETLRRECYEELGVPVEVGRLLFVREYIHANHQLAGKGRDQHKIEFMFECSLLGDPMNTGSDPGQEALEWVLLAELGQIAIYPTVLRDYLSRLTDPTQGVDVYWGDVY